MMKFVAKTLYGLETVLAEELEALDAGNVRPANRAVTFEGDMCLLYKVNYCLRTAVSVLWQIAEFRIRSADDLYRHGSKIRWDSYFSSDQTFSISPVVSSPFFRHTGYAGLILKDAVADRFRNSTGKRPSVDTNDPDIVINLHIDNDRVNVSFDSSVVPLFKRGYRKEQGAAPLNEVLAAGIIHLSGWDPAIALTDPMCGSGTIPIEAAIRAFRIPPGKFRSFFGFQRWKSYDRDLFEAVRKECDNMISFTGVKIHASDISHEAVTKAKVNIKAAGLSEFISPATADFRDLKASDDSGFLIMNPPYGQRIRQEDLPALYSMMGSTLKHRFPGFTAFLITSDREALRYVGLKPSKKITLFNGALECLLARYDMYQGSLKK